jgi:uncharacterized protein YndB with AHSA1/START domain
MEGLAPDDSVRAATGRDWAEWSAWLDARGAADLSHPRIVALLRAEGGVQSGWWRQQVTTGYERRIGRRVVGEAAGGFQIGVRRTLPVAPEEAWRRVTSAEGVAAWLGEPEQSIAWEPGSAFRLRDGATGEVRVCRPGFMIRLHLREPGATRATVIQVRVDAAKTGTTVSFHQEQLPSAEAREQQRGRFSAAAETIAALA